MLGEDVGIALAELGEQQRRALDVGEEKGDRAGRKSAHEPETSYHASTGDEWVVRTRLGSRVWLVSSTRWSGSPTRSAAALSTRRLVSGSSATWTSFATANSRRRTSSSRSATTRTSSS